MFITVSTILFCLIAVGAMVYAKEDGTEFAVTVFYSALVFWGTLETLKYWGFIIPALSN